MDTPAGMDRSLWKARLHDAYETITNIMVSLEEEASQGVANDAMDAASVASNDVVPKIPTCSAYDDLMHEFYSFASKKDESAFDSLIRLRALVEKLNCYEAPPLEDKVVIKKGGNACS
jgi:hypothetical protein